MYTAKMHHNSLLGGPINFIVGGWYVDDPQRVGHKLVAIATPVV